MSNRNPEEARIKELESFRTPRSSDLIDAAIKDGRSPEFVAKEIVKQRLYLTDEETCELEAQALVTEINALRNKNSVI